MDQKRIKIYGRAAFLRVDQPERFQGTGEPRYSGNILVELDSPDHKKILAAMRAAAAEKWGENKADAALRALTGQAKVAAYNGELKPDIPGYDGSFVVQANTKATQPPALVATINGENVKLDNETQSTIYSGCYVNAIVEFWAQDNQWGKRINAQLCGLQFVKDGVPFAGGRPAATDEFEVVESADDDVDFGDEDITF